MKFTKNDPKTRYLALAARISQLVHFKIPAYRNNTGEYSDRDNCYFLKDSLRKTAAGNWTVTVHVHKSDGIQMRTVRLDRIEKVDGRYISGCGKKFKKNRTHTAPKLKRQEILAF